MLSHSTHLIQTSSGKAFLWSVKLIACFFIRIDYSRSFQFIESHEIDYVVATNVNV